MASEAELEAIRASTDIVALVGATVALKRQGGAFWGLCPFHKEQSPSFKVDNDRRRYHCFGCGEDGDAFAWLMKTGGMTFPEAVAKLQGGDIPKTAPMQGPPKKNGKYEATDEDVWARELEDKLRQVRAEAAENLLREEWSEERKAQFEKEQREKEREASLPEPVSALERRLNLGLDMSAKGIAEPNLNNAMLVLEHDKSLKGLIRYDEFLQRIVTGDPPREWLDADDYNLTLYMQREIGITKMGWDTVKKAVVIQARKHSFNSVRDWLAPLQWDGVARINAFFPDYFGARDSAYTRAVSRNFWLSILARIYNPGCKMDNMVVLEGVQGQRKSTALEAIVSKPWFAEQHADIWNKDFYATLQGKLLVEIGEMDAFTKAEVTKVKTVVSCCVDRYRVPWDTHASDHPRQCVFVGTTNRDDWNRDDTGARRFWPVACMGDVDSVDIDGIKRDRDQFFAEAKILIEAGEPYWKMPAEETSREQEDRYINDVWHERIASFIASRSSVKVSDILSDCLFIPLKEQEKRHEMRVAVSLRRLGWKASNQRDGKRVLRVWCNVDDAIKQEKLV